MPARDYVFIVDVSGSMNGFPMQTAAGLVSDLVGSLQEGDTFNLVLFAGSSTVLAPTTPEPETWALILVAALALGWVVLKQRMHEVGDAA